MKPWKPSDSPFVSAGLAAYPDMLNRYIVAKFALALEKAAAAGGWAQELWRVQHPPKPKSTPETVARFSFSEQIAWQNPLAGPLEPTEREKADKMAIGGMRNTSESVGKLSFLSQFGLKLGKLIKDALRRNLQISFFYMESIHVSIKPTQAIFEEKKNTENMVIFASKIDIFFSSRYVCGLIGRRQQN